MQRSFFLTIRNIFTFIIKKRINCQIRFFKNHFVFFVSTVGKLLCSQGILSLRESFEGKHFWCEFLTLARNSHSKLFCTEGGNRTHTPEGTRF